MFVGHVFIPNTPINKYFGFCSLVITSCYINLENEQLVNFSKVVREFDWWLWVDFLAMKNPEFRCFCCKIFINSQLISLQTQRRIVDYWNLFQNNRKGFDGVVLYYFIEQSIYAWWRFAETSYVFYLFIMCLSLFITMKRNYFLWKFF